MKTQTLGWLQLEILTGELTPKLRRALRRQNWWREFPRLWRKPLVAVGEECTHMEKLRPKLPPAANLRFTFITDAQWCGAKTIIGPSTPSLTPTT